MKDFTHTNECVQTNDWFAALNLDENVKILLNKGNIKTTQSESGFNSTTLNRLLRNIQIEVYATGQQCF